MDKTILKQIINNILRSALNGVIYKILEDNHFELFFKILYWFMISSVVSIGMRSCFSFNFLSLDQKGASIANESAK